MTHAADFFSAYDYTHLTQDLSHLPYSSFLAALDDIAIQHPDVRKIADTAVAAELEERVATVASPSAPAASTSLVVSRPESGSASDPRSRPGTGSGTSPSSGDPSGRGSPGATSPTNHGRSITIATGNQGKAGGARSKNRETDGLAVSSRGGKKGGAAEKAAAKTMDVAAVEGFRPDDQRLLVLLQKYVLVKSQAGKEVRADRYTASARKTFLVRGRPDSFCCV